MRIKVRVADPAGNITIFVTTPVEREKYPFIARQLLAREDLKGEQVGFIERKARGGFRMEMMGGEFCGNASRSFGVSSVSAGREGEAGTGSRCQRLQKSVKGDRRHKSRHQQDRYAAS